MCLVDFTGNSLTTGTRNRTIPAGIRRFARLALDRQTALSHCGLYWVLFAVIATRRPGTGGLDGWRTKPVPLSSSCTRASG